jgi:vacuolar-type H+-ATPase subunit C/Vma6
MTAALTGTFSYAYSSATVSALLSKLISPNHLKRLIGTETLEDALDALRSTHYGVAIAGRESEGDAGVSIDRAIYSEIDANIRRLFRASPKKAKPYLLSVLEREENRALKSLLKAMSAGIEGDYAASKIVPFGRFTPDVCGAILREGSVEKALGYVNNTAFRNKMLSVVGKDIRDASVLKIDTYVESQSALRIIEASERLSRTDRVQMKNLLGYESDIRNIVNSLRAIGFGLGVKEARKFWIPFHRYVREPTLAAMVETKDLSKAIGLIPDIYRGIVGGTGGSKRGVLLTIGIMGDRYLVNKYIGVFSGDRMHIGTTWAYIQLLMYEAADLRTILVGKIYGRPRQEIEDNLILTVA